METTAATVVSETYEIEMTEVTESVSTAADYTAYLEQITEYSRVTAESSGLIAGFGLFAVVVALCCFCYKFLRIFF